MWTGPNTVGDALVVLSNLGPDERPRTGKNTSGTFLTECSGRQPVQISLRELGLLLGHCCGIRYGLLLLLDFPPEDVRLVGLRLFPLSFLGGLLR